MFRKKNFYAFILKFFMQTCFHFSNLRFNISYIKTENTKLLGTISIL